MHPALQIAKKNEVLIASVTVLLILVSWFNFLDHQAYEYLKHIMAEALTAFGSAKVLSATVSMMKSLEVGIGVASIQPGHLLKPVGDLAETYADFMRLSIGALITQGILLKIVASWAFKIFITLAGLWFAAVALLGKSNHSNLSFKVFLFAVFLRFSIVVAIGLSLIINNALLQQQVDQRMRTVSQFTTKVEKTGDSQLSEQAKQALRDEIRKSKDKKATAEARLERVSAEIDTTREMLRKNQNALDKRQDELGTFAYLWTDDEKYNRLSEAISADQKKLDRLLDTKSVVQDEYDKAVETIRVNNATLAGKASGLLASFKTSVLGVVSEIGDLKDNIDQLLGSFDDVMSDIIYLIAAFLFRTLIMPLLFLYGLTKAFRMIWGVDIRTAVKTGVKDFNREAKGKT